MISAYLLLATRYLIAVIAPWSVSVMLLLLLGVCASYFPLLLKRVKSMHRGVSLGLVSICILGGLIRFAWVPNGHRVYFDEDRYLSYSINFARHGQAVSLLLSTESQILLGDPDPAARITVPVINAWVLKLFGFDELNLFRFAKLASTVQILLLFIVVLELFDDQLTALFSSSIFAFAPLTVYWSVSTNIDVYFVTFSLLSLLAVILYSRKQSLFDAAFVWLSVFLLLMVRFESFLMLPALGIAALSMRHYRKQKLFVGMDRLVLALLVPVVLIRALVSVPVFSSIWCCAEATPLEIFTTSYVMRNTLPNVLTFVNRPEFPLAITILASLTLFSIRWTRRSRDFRLLIFVYWMCGFFFIYSFYYAGQFYSYTFSGSYGRFFLMESVPLTIFASIALRDLNQSFRKASFQTRNWMLIGAGVLLLSIVPTITSYRRLITTSPWDSLVEVGPRTLHAYIEDVMIPQTPPDSAFIFGVLAPIHLHGKTAIYTDNFMTDVHVMDFVDDYLSKGKPVFMFETHTCDIYPEKCQEILKRFTFDSYPKGDNPKYAGLELKELHRRT